MFSPPVDMVGILWVGSFLCNDKLSMYNSKYSFPVLPNKDLATTKGGCMTSGGEIRMI